MVFPVQRFSKFFDPDLVRGSLASNWFRWYQILEFSEFLNHQIFQSWFGLNCSVTSVLDFSKIFGPRPTSSGPLIPGISIRYKNSISVKNFRFRFLRIFEFYKSINGCTRSKHPNANRWTNRIKVVSHAGFNFQF